MKQTGMIGALFFVGVMVLAGCQAGTQTGGSASASTRGGEVEPSSPPEEAGPSKPFHCAEEAIGRGDREGAFRACLPMAEAGDPDAQHWVGLMYGSGRGVKMDRAESVKWHRRAAAQGDAGSFDSLGFMYWHGGGVVLDKIKAYACFGIAADLMAQYDRPGMTDESRKAKGQYAKTKKFAMDLLAKEMSGAELSEARQLIRECAKKDFLDCGM